MPPIDKTRIMANAKKYFETAQKAGFMTDELMEFLGEDFIAAPASTEYFNNFEGGLIEHILRTTAYAVKFNNSLPEDEKVEQNSLLKVCLLHQIGKAKMFVPCESEWHRKNLNRTYDFKKDSTPMRVGERSVFYAINHGVTFTEEEFKVMLLFDNESSQTVLGDLLKMANMFAVRHAKKFDENNEK
jgi:23S rRNA maturation-related 3'-5' exoribonuclease YhaM